MNEYFCGKAYYSKLCPIRGSGEIRNSVFSMSLPELLAVSGGIPEPYKPPPGGRSTKGIGRMVCSMK